MVIVVTREKLSVDENATTKDAGDIDRRDDGALFNPLPDDGFQLNGGANEGDVAAADGGWPPYLLGCGGTRKVAASAEENTPDEYNQGSWTTGTTS